MRSSVAIVGGGVLGMTLADRFVSEGHDVTLIEAAPTFGGLAAAWTIDTPTGPVTWDRHYHVTLLSDSHTRGMLRELSLEDEMRFVETRTGYHAGGRLFPASNAIEFLRLPALRLLDKLRIGATIVYASRVRDWQRLARVDAATWLRKCSGRRAFERFWLPQLRAKLGTGATEVSASFMWATIQRLYAARRTGLKKELFGYVPGGYARVFDAFTARLASAGVDLQADRPVRAIRGAIEGVRVEYVDGSDAVFDRVVVTAAAPVASRLCPDLRDDERAALERVRYMGIVCMSVVLRRPLGGFYLTYLADEAPFTAVVEMSSFVDPAEFGGHTLVYLPKYVAPEDPMFERSDDEIAAEFVAALLALFPDVSAADVLATRISRVRHVFAVPTVESAGTTAPVRTSVPGLFLVGSANIVNGTLNVDETLALAERAADGILSDFEREPITES